MNQVPTAMREAFRDALKNALDNGPASATSKPAELTSRALKRKVGLTTRKTMWSVQRGTR